MLGLYNKTHLTVHLSVKMNSLISYTMSHTKINLYVTWGLLLTFLSFYGTTLQAASRDDFTPKKHPNQSHDHNRKGCSQVIPTVFSITNINHHPSRLHGLSLPSGIPGLSHNSHNDIPHHGNHSLRGGHIDSLSYEVWNPEISTVAIKKLLDTRFFGAQSIFMGIAKIDTDLKIHYHSASEIYYVLRGRGKIVLGRGVHSQVVDLVPGRFLYIPPNLAHYTVAESKDPVEILYIFPRNEVAEVEYKFFDEGGWLQDSTNLSIVGRIPVFHGEQRYLSRQTLVAKREGVEKGLMMERWTLPPGEVGSAMATASQIFFVRHGRGIITMETIKGASEKYHLSEGSYFYMEEGNSYTIQSSSKKGLDILIFQPL